MKKFSLSILFCLWIGSGLMAQTPPPPNNGDSGSGSTTPVGGGAPIDGGIFILFSAGLAYAYGKYRINDIKLEN